MIRAARRDVIAALTILSLGLALTLSAGCAEEKPCACPAAKVLDRKLMLLLSSSRSYHHQADIFLQQGEVDRAISTVRKILELGLDSRWPEAEEVRLDASARLAKLLLGKGEEKQAAAAVKQGITGALRDSFYLANLHSVRGEILEHRTKRLGKEGDGEGARRSAREAIAAFERSISINRRLQKKLLKKGARR